MDNIVTAAGDLSSNMLLALVLEAPNFNGA